jgi:hypothetical protein
MMNSATLVTFPIAQSLSQQYVFFNTSVDAGAPAMFQADRKIE